MTNERDTPENNEAIHTLSTAELAERYLDFWQRNLTTWSSDPDLFQKWARQILKQQDTKLATEQRPDGTD